MAYTVVNGTSYDERTPAAVRDVLESARAGGYRIRIFYGDTATGRDWHEENDVTGRIGRSSGPVKAPIILANARSSGGPQLLDDSIVKIARAAGGAVLYQHPAYCAGVATLREETDPAMLAAGYFFAVDIDGENFARFRTRGQAQHYMRKMGLTQA